MLDPRTAPGEKLSVGKSPPSMGARHFSLCCPPLLFPPRTPSTKPNPKSQTQTPPTSPFFSAPSIPYRSTTIPLLRIRLTSPPRID
ncbi:hypothetical protein BU26DRAFT_65328 [Trematosphaeria pertusa]|uniref:Uncharacterized protein n=1 Tax=Trematosphaeria pertusa TaxID=390896 RepID=A0A6A6I6X5_9PLEO|nr:uncharacterized protein BU26DRAFT_65328 [Trematosphaeria pertusa]KAF2246275.1 hypothetical protein BU26DRAFT_65328 [Trematosphaeria pertusa]